MTGDQTARLREHLLYLLKGGGAHLNFDKAIAGLPAALRGAKPPGVPHTPWRLLTTRPGYAGVTSTSTNQQSRAPSGRPSSKLLRGAAAPAVWIGIRRFEGRRALCRRVCYAG